MAASLSYMKEHFSLEKSFEEQCNSFSEEGKTPLFFARGEKLLGCIAVADTLKEDAKAGIERAEKARHFHGYAYRRSEKDGKCHRKGSRSGYGHCRSTS